MKVIVLTIRPEPVGTRDEDQSRIGKFIALLNGKIVLRGTRQPLVDGARALVKLGYDADELLTMRTEGAAYDSFVPQPIRDWAQWTYKEGEEMPLRRTRWESFPGVYWSAGNRGVDGSSTGDLSVATPPLVFRRTRRREQQLANIANGLPARRRMMTKDDMPLERARVRA